MSFRNIVCTQEYFQEYVSYFSGVCLVYSLMDRQLTPTYMQIEIFLIYWAINFNNWLLSQVLNLNVLKDDLKKKGGALWIYILIIKDESYISSAIQIRDRVKFRILTVLALTSGDADPFLKKALYLVKWKHIELDDWLHDAS